jgi:hypothetical protein
MQKVGTALRNTRRHGDSGLVVSEFFLATDTSMLHDKLVDHHEILFIFFETGDMISKAFSWAISPKRT